MMQQLQQERAAASNVIAEIIQPILDEVIDLVVLESEESPPPPVSFPESPESPAYLPPEIEDEDEAIVSAEVGESVSYECVKCQLRGDNRFEIMMHLEEDHDLPGEEDILRMYMREMKTKEKTEAAEVPDSTTKISVKENNNENSN